MFGFLDVYWRYLVEHENNWCLFVPLSSLSGLDQEVVFCSFAGFVLVIQEVTQ